MLATLARQRCGAAVSSRPACCAAAPRAALLWPLARPAAAASNTWGRPSSSVVGASVSARPAAAAGYCAAPRRAFSDGTISITVATARGNWTSDVKLGETLMDIALDNDLDMECACEGQLACSTCHVYIHEDFFDLIPEIEEEEEDMLDLAWGLEDNSRLGCQIEMTPELDGCTFTIPEE